MPSLRRTLVVSLLTLLSTVAFVVAAPIAGAGETSVATSAAAGIATSAAAAAPGPGSVTGGGSHVCVLTGAGGGKCWGYNSSGGLGDGTTTARLSPVDVSGQTSGLVAIDAGGQTTCAITTSGGARCWGANARGQVGDGTTTNRRTPTDVSGLGSGVAAVSVGYYHACALTTAGGVKCWGANGSGQLGDGTTTERHTPVDVSGLTAGVSAVSTGLDDGQRDHSCALTTTGGVKCWGDNSAGQLGDGTTTPRSAPVDVVGLTSGVAGVFAGGRHTCAVTTSGGAKCWGANDGGQLGDGTTTERHTPVDVSGLTSGVARLDLSQSSSYYGPGESHTCALTTAGGVKCWGRNTEGEAGDGTSGNARLVPVDVVGLTSGVVAVAVTFWTGCAVTSAGAVRCWGHGSTGDGTGLARLTPVDVSGSFFRPECPTMIASDHSGFVLSDGYATGSVATFDAETGYLLIGSTTSTCTSGLTWSDPAPVAVAPTIPTAVPGQARLAEGDSGPVDLAVPITLSGPTSLTVTVPWSTIYANGAPGDQADPATDYTPVSGTVTFLPGQTSATVNVPVSGDLLVEPDEYVVVSFTNPTNARMGGYWGLGFGVITDDDTPVVLAGATSVVEGNSGMTAVEVPVTLTKASTLPVTVSWTTLLATGAPAYQADPSTDYVPVSGTVTFAPGETAKTVTIDIVGDDVVEPDEYVVVSFTNPVNARMGGFWGLGFAVITNDD